MNDWDAKKAEAILAKVVVDGQQTFQRLKVRMALAHRAWLSRN